LGKITVSAALEGEILPNFRALQNDTPVELNRINGLATFEPTCI